jgi:ABC-type transport system involved in cytochrome bd biosynthesis fused ATPase/permease subunit
MRGTSGSGKSTLALALNGFLSYSGSATIGGIEISKINDLSESIVASLQKGHIFNTTLRENLKIAHPSATDAQIIEVLDLVELSDIDLDTLLGVYGRPISGGEAKRLGVARALLSPAPIIILDEPTEHLDQALANRIEERIRMRCKDRALIVITHEGWLKSTRTVIIERE